MPDQWDMLADVVVVGFGGAGIAAAVTSHDLGSDVLILEKAPEGREGGNTRIAAQGYLNTSDPDNAETYLTALCGPFTVPEKMIRVWAEEMSKNNDWLAAMGGDPQEHQHQPEGIEFPELPGSTCVHKFHDGDKYGYSLTWKRFDSFVRERDIRIEYECPGTGLVQDPATGEIRGVVAEKNGKPVRIKAQKGVILCTGGFENNQDMIRNYLPGLAYCYPSGTPYNTGDGITMAQEVGADLWHMNNYAGPSMAFKTPAIPSTMSMQALHFSKVFSGGMIVVGPDGKRFCDEKFKTRHGKVPLNGQWKPLAVPTPMYMIFDETMMNAAPLYNKWPNRGWTAIMEQYDWSDDNRKELASGWIKQAATVQDLAKAVGLKPHTLAETVQRWNAMMAQGGDVDFGRKLMLDEFDKGPYYAIELSPSMINTQGGPRRNEKAEILKPNGTPIPRLYSAGELGSIYSYLYQGTGNIGECIAFGRIAGRNAAALENWN
ncbi:MAG: FAD-binding protein [Rhodospirillaceae bacterium]